MGVKIKTILIYFAYKYNGDWDKIYEALNNKEPVSFDDITKIEKQIKVANWKILTILDLHYPRQLKLAYKPPFVLWYQGNLTTLEQNFICLTGNKSDDKISEKVKQFMTKINPSHAIVSSLFFDLDQKILSYYKIKTNLIILPHGLNFNHGNLKYPQAFLLTEYPDYVQQNMKNIQATNRLLAAFASYLIIFSFNVEKVVSDDEKIMINLINNFFNLGKDVFCFPGNGENGDGNSQLIKQGIKLITTSKDLPF